MDYTEFPRELMYKEKASLKDFGVNNEMTIEHRFYEGLLKRPSIKDCLKKRETILRIFNNAYYLCTLILMDEDPRLSIDSYRKKAENSERTIDWVNHFAPMTMALVYLELKGCQQECACGVRIFDEFLSDDIYEHYRDWDTKGASEGKADFYELVGNEEQQYIKLPSESPSFPPRTITIKSIGEAFDNNGYIRSLRYFTHDYDMERIAEIFRYLGRTKEEKEALRDALKWDIDSFGDEGRKYRFLAQLDGMDFSSAEHAVEQGMEARYSRALLEISIQEKEVHQLNKEISQLKLKAQNADDMMPPSENQDFFEQSKAELAASNDRVSELESENEELRAFKQEIEELKEMTPDERLGIDERAIYFSTSLGLDFDPKRTNQKQLSIMISEMSGDLPSSIRGRISRMHKMEVDKQFSDEILQAARNVIGYLEKVPRGNQTPKVKEMIENIDLVFLNAKNS